MQSQLQEKLETSAILNLEKLAAAELMEKPYQYLIVPEFIRNSEFEGIINDYPDVKKGGSFPLSSVKYGRNFVRLIEELNSPAFRQVIEKKFNVDLAGRPTMFTVRGQCRAGRDGKIHTDSESKIITVLLYMNHEWENQGGKLRVLNSDDINDVAAEVPPMLGTLLAFKRSDNSYHGHLPFTGDRKVIQMNWVTAEEYVGREQTRHSRSSWWKGLFGGVKDGY